MEKIKKVSKRVCACLSAVMVLCVCFLSMASPAEAIAWTDEPDIYMPFAFYNDVVYGADRSVYTVALPQSYYSGNSTKSWKERNYAGDAVLSYTINSIRGNYSEITVRPLFTSETVVEYIFTSETPAFYDANEPVQFMFNTYGSDATVDVYWGYSSIYQSGDSYSNKWEQELIVADGHTTFEVRADDVYVLYRLTTPVKPIIITDITIIVKLANPSASNMFGLGMPRYSVNDFSSRVNVLSKYDATIVYPSSGGGDISVDFSGWLSTAVGGFWAFQIYPGITLGGVFATIFGLMLVIVFVKIFSH